MSRPLRAEDAIAQLKRGRKSPDGSTKRQKLAEGESKVIDSKEEPLQQAEPESAAGAEKPVSAIKESESEATTKEVEPKDAESKDAEAKDAEAKDAKAEEPEHKEVEAKEPDSKPTEAAQPEAEKPESTKAGSKENQTSSGDPDSKKAQSKESESKESESKESEPEDADSKDAGKEAESPAEKLEEPAGPKVNNQPVLDDVAHFERRQLGSVLYAPHKLLALGHELDFNCVLQVRISHWFLGESLDERPLWGTDVYTDDTDLVAALRHLGHETSDKNDMLVEILLLPSLRSYTGSKRHGVLSRTWLRNHDGISYMVLRAQQMPRGWATAGRDTLAERYEALAELRRWDPVAIAECDMRPSGTASEWEPKASEVVS